jgi:Icc-related predicted phosphoesterase
MKILFISDTHGHTPHLPSADLLIHCGDICPRGEKLDFQIQLAWLLSMKAQFPKGMILSPGNHDCVVEEERAWAREMAMHHGVDLPVHERRVIGDVTFFFSPYTPTFYNWSFMADDMILANKWADIPDDTQVLVTHGPAKYVLDEVPSGNVGSETLRQRVVALDMLKVHACGHIHEGAGHAFGLYQAINAAALDGRYHGYNPAYMVDTLDWHVTEHALRD